ncbi:MAG TPA: transcription elongation factor GreA [Dehalococcoidia bacterium]|jgi:transcription elongation factor GreA|nr:transcription elongation factor GreA [Dehalococcoidia bacterium]
MPQKEYIFTPQGLAKLEAELDHLRKVRRQEVAEKIQRAKEMGGTANNAEYEDAKNEQAFVEGRILTLENMIKHAVVIERDNASPQRVELGSRVTLRNQDGKPEVYFIVGSAEANPNEGRISNESPVGQALLGKKVGDEVEITVPAGVLKLIITEIN